VIVSVGLVALPTAIVVGAPQAGAGTAHVAAATAPTYTWPSIRDNTTSDGVNGDPTVSASNASTLGVRWMTPTGAAVMSSPVAAYNQQLGKTLIYVGNQAGTFEAVDQATGDPVWSDPFGSAINSAALVEGSSVWVAPSTAYRFYKLNAATGAVECSAPTPAGFVVDASPQIATPPGGVPTVYLGVNDEGTFNGPMLAIAESNCAVLYSSTPEPEAGSGGSWDPVSYAVDANGEGLTLFGTADPDSAVYAIDAVTGKLVWRVATYNPPPGVFDVGAGVVVSPPGVNGFADGMAYVENKDGIMYAIDLTDGAVVWTYNFGAVTGYNPPGSLATAALSGDTLVTGTAGGIDALDATTGALLWRYNTGDSQDIDASPIITGPVGNQAVSFATLDGAIDVVSLATGSLLYTYQTGGFVVSSMADTDGNLIETSADGYLYDFALGGGNTAAPTTQVTSPADGSALPNPGGAVTVTGTASGTSIGGVDVAVQEGGSEGLWWDSATGTWTASPYPNPATVASPGATTSSWSLSVPIGQGGGGFEVFATAVASTGRVDITPYQSQPSGGRVSFTVAASPHPHLSVSSNWIGQGSTLMVSGTGFAPSEQVTLSFGGAYDKTFTASTTGALSAISILIEPADSFGPQTLVATGVTSGRSTTATFNISNAWSQFLDTSTRQAEDPGDKVFQKRLSVSSNVYLGQAWSFMSGAPVRTSVSMVDGVAYFGNDAGAVYAVNIHSGTQLWRYQDVGSKPIDSSPAVDGANVIFGTAAGSVVELNATTGSVRWVKVYAQGKAVESSPAVVNGVIYVGSDNDMMTALNESTGAILWQRKLGGAVASSPAVDSTTGQLFVGAANGDIYALSTATGAVVWTVVTGGAVTASPMVLAGVVYVGSTSGVFYALKEQGGTTVWSYKTGGPITSSATTLDGDIVMGSADKNVYWLSADTGAVVFAIPEGSAVSGVSGAGPFDVATTANGTIIGSKPNATDNRAWVVSPLSASATIVSTPTVVNGEVFVTRQDGSVTCYTVPGSPPV
jgi:outer membrane protein assembly factor BamB